MLNSGDLTDYVLLEFINQCPYGLIGADETGVIQFQNAAGSNLLTPIFIEQDIDPENILDLLKTLKTELYNLIIDFQEDYGKICDSFTFKNDLTRNLDQYLSFTVIKISPTVYEYAFQDITAQHLAQIELNATIEESAIQAGRLEISSGILHDIGNAASAFGAEISKIRSSADWREISDLQKLNKLFENQSEKIDTALGEGKSSSLQRFVSSLAESLDKKSTRLTASYKKLYQLTSHIQEILSIQMHYASSKEKKDRGLVNLNEILEDSLSIQENSFTKRQVQLNLNLDRGIPPISGDRTKLIQVVINVLKNALEAFDEASGVEKKEIYVQSYSSEKEKQVGVVIRDNAVGFPPEEAENLLKRGVTSKNSGSGFGLYNCCQIISSHKGKIKIESPGPGKGSTVTIQFYYE